MFYTPSFSRHNGGMRNVFMMVFLLVMCWPVGAFAQVVIDGEEIYGEGSKGRYTQEQAEQIALHFISIGGEIVSRSGYTENDRFFHEFFIEVADGSIYDIEVNANNGLIHRVEVEYLSPRAKVPFDLIERKTAQQAALSYVATEIDGRFTPKIIDRAVLVAYERALSFRVRVKKLASRYSVWVDAFTGEVRDIKKD